MARGRDHGMPRDNDMRRAYGLPPKTSFAAITGERTERWPRDVEIDSDGPLLDADILDYVELRDAAGNLLEPGSEAADAEAVTGVRRTPLAARLRVVYGGDLRSVDSFVGMLSEPHAEGSELGELQLAIWKRQFEALRDGDRFFYELDQPMRALAAKYGIPVERRLRDVIVSNTHLERADLQLDVFKERPEQPGETDAG